MEMKNLHAGDLWPRKMLNFLCLNANFSAEVLSIVSVMKFENEELSDALREN